MKHFLLSKYIKNLLLSCIQKLTINIVVLTGLISPGFAQDFTNAIELNGTTSYVHANDISDALNGISELTLEVWVKPFSLVEKNFVLTFHETNANNKRNVILFGITASGKLSLSYNEGIRDNDNYGEITTIPINTWTHLALTIASDHSATAYINGQPEISTTIPVRPVTGGTFSIGQDWDYPSISDVVHGQLDEVRVWNVARTQQQIQDNMNTELEGTENGLVAYYKMYDGTGTQLTDNSGNGHTGTLEGGVQWINNPPAAHNDPTNGSYQVYCGETVSGNVLNNDTDVEGNDIDVAAEPTLSYGSFESFNLETGDFVYRAPMDYTGELTFSYHATDGGLSDLATVTINIVDTISPIADGKDLTVYLGNDGTATITEEDMLQSFIYSTETATYSSNLLAVYKRHLMGVIPSDFDSWYFSINNSERHRCFYDGEDGSWVSYRVDIDGYSSTPKTSELFGSLGTKTIEFFNDNCGDVHLSYSKSNFTCNNVGENEIIVTTTDVNGNSSDTVITITVVDDIAPKVVTHNVTVQLDENG